jgi:hypothetical protein
LRDAGVRTYIAGTKSEGGLRENGIRFHAEMIRCILLVSREQQIECPGSTTCEEVTTLKRIVVVFVLLLSLFAMTSWADEMTGYISDSKCGAKGASDSHADCAVKCVKGGALPVFVSDGKVYKISDPSKVQDHVGHKVTITGTVKGDTIDVQEVKM